MKKTYAMFRVYDYKGGELRSEINIKDKGELVCDLFENCNFDGVKNKEDILAILKEKEKSELFYSTYASSDRGGFTGEIFEISDNEMKQITVESCLPACAKYIAENWRLF